MSLNVMDQASTNKFHHKVTFLSGMGVFLEGYDFTNIASALIFLVPYFKLTGSQTTFLAISTFVGTFFGAILIGYLADKFGRRRLYMLDIAMYAGFSLLSAISPNYTVLLLSRIGLGFAIGADQALSFAIIAEFVPKKTRGRLNGSTWILWALGSLITYLLSYSLRPIFGIETWRVVFLLGMVPAIIVMVMRHSLPESPRWLIAQGRKDDAQKAIMHTTLDQANVSATEIAASTETMTYIPDLFKTKAQLKRTLYISFMWFCNTFNVFGIGFFTPVIMKTLGFTDERSLLGGLIVSIFPLMGAIIMTASVDRIGRKFLASLGFALLSLINLIIAFTSQNIYFPLLLLLFGLFQMSAWIGPASLVGVVAPEVFPTSIRTTGVGFAAAMGRLGSILGITLNPILLRTMGFSNSMFIYFSIAFIGFLAMRIFGVETKGKALEEIVAND
ncbi:MAG: MFS transporter [Desulfitobacteriaceae bacterium]